MVSKEDVDFGPFHSLLAYKRKHNILQKCSVQRGNTVDWLSPSFCGYGSDTVWATKCFSMVCIDEESAKEAYKRTILLCYKSESTVLL